MLCAPPTPCTKCEALLRLSACRVTTEPQCLPCSRVPVHRGPAGSHVAVRSGARTPSADGSGKDRVLHLVVEGLTPNGPAATCERRLAARRPGAIVSPLVHYRPWLPSGQQLPDASPEGFPAAPCRRAGRERRPAAHPCRLSHLHRLATESTLLHSPSMRSANVREIDSDLARGSYKRREFW